MLQQPLPKDYRKLAPVSARRDVWAALLPRRSRAAFRLGVSSAVALADVVTIFGTAYVVDIAYSHASMGTVDASGTGLQIAGILCLVIPLTNLVRDDYSIDSQIARGPHLRRAEIHAAFDGPSRRSFGPCSSPISWNK